MMYSIAEWFIHIWLYAISGVTGGMICYLAIKWRKISTQKKLLGLFTIAITLHILEEWVWPAGLAYIHNLWLNSPRPSAYPMNQFSDMITNSLAVIIMLLVMWKLSENAVAGLTAALFGIGEACAHTQLGIVSVQKFHKQGLLFPYSPGLATAIFGFLVIAILLIVNLKKQKQLHWTTFGLAIISLIVIMLILVVIPEGGLKDLHTRYAFPSAGFYQQFINK